MKKLFFSQFFIFLLSFSLYSKDTKEERAIKFKNSVLKMLQEGAEPLEDIRQKVVTLMYSTPEIDAYNRAHGYLFQAEQRFEEKTNGLDYYSDELLEGFAEQIKDKEASGYLNFDEERCERKFLKLTRLKQKKEELYEKYKQAPEYVIGDKVNEKLYSCVKLDKEVSEEKEKKEKIEKEIYFRDEMDEISIPQHTKMAEIEYNIENLSKRKNAILEELLNELSN